MIRFENVGKRYWSGHEALTDVSFHIEPGEMVFLTGRSGAGKSTVLRMLSLVARPSRGKVFVDGIALASVARRGIPKLRRGIGMVFQDHRLLLDRSVFDNVALPLRIRGMANDEVAKRVRAALDKVSLLNKERAAPATLSTGEQQRVGIARAIVAKPPLIIADEPTGNLDPQLSMEIMQLFAEFAQVGTTVLIASHDLHQIKRMNKRVLVLDNGKLVDDFRPGASA